MSKRKPQILKTKQDIFRFVTDDKALFECEYVGKNPRYWYHISFVVDGMKYRLFLQMYVKTDRVDYIDLRYESGNIVTPNNVRELRQRIFEIRDSTRVKI